MREDDLGWVAESNERGECATVYCECGITAPVVDAYGGEDGHDLLCPVCAWDLGAC